MAKNKAAVLSVLNVTWRLLVICLAVAALTALVFEITEAPIAAGERACKEEAIRTIFADAADFEEGAGVEADGVNAVYMVKDGNGKAIGLCFDYTGKSDYGGDVNMMIGVGPDGRVIGLQVISHSETFMDRYTDEEGYYTGIGTPYGTDLSAGATMSYRAIRDAISAVEALCVPDGAPAEKPDAPPIEEEADPTPQSAFTEAAVSQFFGNGVVFSDLDTVSNANVIAACVVESAEGEALGHCVKYQATGGHNGSFDLLLARSADSRVFGVQVLAHFEQSMEQYVDQNMHFDLTQDAVAGATETYDAVRNAVAAVEALQLGGVA